MTPVPTSFSSDPNFHKVIAALKTMKKHKAQDTSAVLVEMIQATGYSETQWLTDLCNGIVKEGAIRREVLQRTGNPV